MTELSFFQKHAGKPLDEVAALPPEPRANAVHAAFPDLHFFFDDGQPIEGRDVPERSRTLARSLFDTLSAAPPTGEAPARAASTAASLRERIITEDLLRAEADRDQNVYLGKLFTRTLTQAKPDVIFQPASAAEAAQALRWAREQGVPLTLRGAASTAMGGSVPNDGGLTLDLSRLDTIDVVVAERVCVIGAGARLRTVHQRLAEHGLALRAYPSNLGGTLAGWFVTGGIGMNAFGRGRALDHVRAADVLLPAGEHVRFHDDGRLDVPEETGRQTLAPGESAEWFRARGLEPMTLADLAGSEGVLGLVLQLIVTVEPRPRIGAFLLSFARRDAALEAAEWIASAASERFLAPANLKFLSSSHLHLVRKVWQDEDARDWREHPGALSSGANLPWTRVEGPEAFGVATDAEPHHGHDGGYLMVDFIEPDAARAFAGCLEDCPGRPVVLGTESRRFAAERFRPQQTKRLGPGLLAAEIVMPSAEVRRYLPRAESLARAAGAELDAEVYYLADGTALVIAAYLTDHRRGGFAVDLTLAPVLLDLAMRSHRGRPYVLGRWQSSYLERKVGAEGAQRVRAMKQCLDPSALVNRGVLLGLRLHGPLGATLAATFAGGITTLGLLYAIPGVGRLARAVCDLFPGPARGRGAPAEVGATFRVTPVEGAATAAVPVTDAAAPEDRALHCVNCGECNSVCPIFVESKIRLPQMLTHAGEAMRAGEAPSAATSTLLDLCMRCGNCEEVCQAGIPHLPLYQVMQARSDEARPHDRERHAAIVMAVRGSTRYTRDFLSLRPGGYLKRQPASLPGTPRFVVLRSENDAGPAATCIHCGGCVSVCPTHANREFEGSDPRWITTLQERCIGCGTCVEVCPANLANGGQTLRVMEAPTLGWLDAIREFEGRQP